MKSNCNPAAPPYSPLKRVFTCHMHVFSEHLKELWLHHLPGQSVFDNPVLYNLFCEEMFTNIQSKPNPVQTEAISHYFSPHFYPPLVLWEKRLILVSLQPPVRELYRAIRSPLSLLFSKKHPQLPQTTWTCAPSYMRSHLYLQLSCGCLRYPEVTKWLILDLYSAFSS